MGLAYFSTGPGPRAVGTRNDVPEFDIGFYPTPIAETVVAAATASYGKIVVLECDKDGDELCEKERENETKENGLEE